MNSNSSTQAAPRAVKLVRGSQPKRSAALPLRLTTGPEFTRLQSQRRDAARPRQAAQLAALSKQVRRLGELSAKLSHVDPIGTAALPALESISAIAADIRRTAANLAAECRRLNLSIRPATPRQKPERKKERKSPSVYLRPTGEAKKPGSHAWNRHSRNH
jgi:hypothetical protein